MKKKLEAAEANKQAATNPEIDKIAYLTFDDGPSDNTIKILDILKENNIRATFFVNGNSGRKEIYQRIVNEGHIIGNHTYSHDYAALYKTIDGFIMDKLTKNIKQCGIKYFDWNVDSTDASAITQDKDIIISEVLQHSKNKKQAIILMHDSSPKTTTAQALPAIIKGLKAQEFKFIPLSAQVNAIQFK